MGNFVGSGAKTLATVDLFSNYVLPRESPTVLTLLGDSAGTMRILRTLWHRKQIIGVDVNAQMVSKSQSVVDELNLANVKLLQGNITELSLKKRVGLIDLDWCQTLSPRTMNNTIQVAKNCLAPGGSIIVSGSVGHGFSEETKGFVRIRPCSCKKCAFGAPEANCARRLSYVEMASFVEDYIQKNYNSDYSLVHSFDYRSDYFSMLYCYLRPEPRKNPVHKHFPQMEQDESAKLLRDSKRFSLKQIVRLCRN